MHQMKTKDGFPTRYAFACGYIFSFEKDGKRTEIWQYGATSHYNIRTHCHKTHTRLAWDDAPTIREAKKALTKHKKAFYGKG